MSKDFLSSCLLWAEFFFFKGMRRSSFQWKKLQKKGASVKRGEAFSEWGFGKEISTGKGNSVKRSGPFSEPPDSWKLKSFCPHPLPENQLLYLSHMKPRHPPFCRAQAGKVVKKRLGSSAQGDYVCVLEVCRKSFEACCPDNFQSGHCKIWKILEHRKSN